MHKTAIVLIVAAQALAAEPGAAPRTAISPAQADSFARKLDSLLDLKARLGKEKKGKSDAAVVVTEGELNSYVNLTLAPLLPAGLSGVELQLDRDHVSATAEVEIEEVRKHVKDLGRFNPLALMNGSVPVMLSGRYMTAEDGFGRVEIEEARAAGVPIPLGLLEQMIVGATKSARQPDGFDIHAPFRLPHPVRRVRLMPGRALLDL
jgi:hypothetical protein